MRLLLTSDWQSEFSTLDLCEVALAETLAGVNKYKPDAVVNGGDLKEQYSPVDVRVVKFNVRATKKLSDTGVPYYVDLGNHDRVSQSLDSKNWLDILRVAGAKTFSIPKWKQVSDGWLAFLPFNPDKKQLKQWANELRASAPTDTKPQILVFHNEVQGGVINSSGQETCGYSVKALRMHEYTACFGGHIHGHQQIAKNVWYIGSPFCMDWSEANQKKGYLLVDVTSGGVQVRQIQTKIPGWYDIQYLEKHKLVPEDNAHIRSKVPVTSKKLSLQLKEEEARIRSLYPESKGLRLFVVPKIEDKEETVIVKGATELEKVQAYVKATWPDTARASAKTGVSYLSGILQTVAPASRYCEEIRFLSAEGENILPFKHIKIPYAKQGLVYLQGVNRDWPKQSNGSGKTSALSLLTLILTGETPKGQKTDEWANERTKDRAWGVLRLRDERKRLIEIERSRRPHGLWLKVDGKDESSGITGKGKLETQGMIERVTGYDKKMLMNAVYIDQTITNGFVFGTQSMRMSLIGRLQNLEMYDAAAKLVSKDIVKNRETVSDLEHNLESHEADVIAFEDELKELESEKKTDWVARRKKAKKHLDAVVFEQTLLQGTKQKTIEQKQQLLEVGKKLGSVSASYGVEQKKLSKLKWTLSQAEKLLAVEKCPTCSQPSQSVGEAMKKKVVAAIKMQEAVVADLKDTVEQYESVESQLSEGIQSYEFNVSKLKDEVAHARELYEATLEGAKEEEARNAHIEKKKVAYRDKLQKAKAVVRACRRALQALDIEHEVMLYAKKAFHRSGMPMYLSVALCPVLNKAADEYSEIFNDGKIKIRFFVEDGEFTVGIINPSGSGKLKGQSCGESAMAGVVCAFALRDVAPKTNLLILDEPGHGLDSEGAKKFAQGLLKLKDRYETILVTTHSPIIAGILQGEKTWTVIKEKGISTLSLS